MKTNDHISHPNKILIQDSFQKSKYSDFSFNIKILITCIILFLFIFLCMLIFLLTLGLTGKLSPCIFNSPNQGKNSATKFDRNFIIISKTRPLLEKYYSNKSLNHSIKTVQAQTCGVTYYQNSVSISRNINSRIVYGVQALPYSQPWIISIRSIKSSSSLSEHICGGALITDQHVLTAAHCVENLSAENTAILVGIYNLDDFTQENLYLVESISINEQYTGSTTNYVANDLAVLKLNNRVTLSDKVQIICLPSPGDSIIGEDVIVSGWGDSDSGYENVTPQNLQTTKMRVINNDPVCDSFGRWDSQNNLCVFDPYNNPSSNVCFGDSGSPLVRVKDNKWTLYGVTSYVLVERDLFGRGKCANDKPSYFSNVANFLDWINEKIAY